MKKIEQNIEDFIEYLSVEKNKNPLTIRNYKHYLGRLVALAGVQNPEDITDESVKIFKKELSSLKLNPKTINYHLITLRQFLRFLARREIASLSSDKIELFENIQTKKFDLISKEELEVFLTHKVNPQSDLLSNLLFSTGLRIFELSNIKIEEIRQCSFTVRGKGGKNRIAFLSEDTCSMLMEFLGERKTGPIFINKRGVGVSIRYLQRIIEERADKLSMSKHVSCHTLRHLFATDLMENGADIRSIQEMLGHSNISTTQLYTHVSNEHLKNSFNKFHSNFNKSIV